MKKQTGLLIFALLLLVACQSKNPINKQEKYFSLPAYIHQEIPDILQHYHKAIKIITVNGHSDTTTILLDSGQLKNFFQPIISADINKPALRGTYDISNFTDSTSGKISIVYTSNTDNTQPYQVYLNLGNDHNISSLYIITTTHNVLYDSSKKLIYQAGKFIQIITDQKMIFFPARKTAITILFEG